MTRLLLHGVPVTTRIWDGVRAALDADGLRSLAPDLPLTLDGAIAAAEAALDEAGGGPAHLVGHDFGGLVAAYVAARRPVASVTLCSTALGWGWLPAKLGAYPPLDRWMYRRFEGSLWLDRGVAPAARPDLRAAFPLRPGLGAEMASLARSFRLPEQHALPTKWRDGDGGRPPVRLVWGTADTSLRPLYARLLAARLGAPIRWLPGRRHYAMWEDPAGFAAALRDGWAPTGAGR